MAHTDKCGWAISNLWCNSAMDDWNLEEKTHLVSDNYYNNVNPYSPHKILQGRTNNIGLTFSVGDTIPRFPITIEQDN